MTTSTHTTIRLATGALLLMGCLVWGATGCSSKAPQSCTSVLDCLANESCESGFCRASTSSGPDAASPQPDAGHRPDLGHKPDAGTLPEPQPKQDGPSTQPDQKGPQPDTAPPPPVVGKEFASQPSTWSIPTAAFCDPTYASGSRYWATMDIDGDGKPDLVWTRSPEEGQAFSTGGAHWKVFKNTGRGFASQPVSWRVPTPAFDRTAYAYGSKHWVTMDIDGDQKPDLVWTRDPEGSGAFATGGAHWKVFKNTGSGFASQPVSWQVPAPAFDRTTYASGSKHWVTMDIDGDQKPDLVWTRNPEGSDAFDTGGSHWKVFKNTGRGFASQPVSWRVPAPAFDRMAYAYGSKHWVTMDIDGDQKPDLVWTRNPEGSGAFDTGGPHWKVFKNTGSGFASQPISWWVPAPAFDRTVYASGAKQWVTMDLDGDGKPDLVWTRDPEGSGSFAAGGPHWKVFKNTGKGFTKQPTSWRIPGTSFSRTAYAYGSKRWSTFDLNGDKRPDLLWTRDPNASSCESFQQPAHWKLFLNQ